MNKRAFIVRLKVGTPIFSVAEERYMGGEKEEG